MYAYKYTLSRRAIIATSDLSAENLQAFKEDHWLLCEKNVIVLQVTWDRHRTKILRAIRAEAAMASEGGLSETFILVL